jgi:glycosyltransferase involved in cell wall biosynthesis
MVDALSIVPYYTGHLCDALRQTRGIQTTLASTTYQHDPEFFARRGVTHNRGLIDFSHRFRNCPAMARRALKLGEYLLNLGCLLVNFVARRPDVVHIQFLPLLSRGLRIEAWWLWIIRLLGIKLVYTVHNVLPQDGTGGVAAYRRVYRLADRFICHDPVAAHRMLREFNVPSARVSTIPHGPLFENECAADGTMARKRLGFAVDECIVLCQGILRPYKGVSFLLRAWRVVCKQEKTTRLAIVGLGDAGMLQGVRDEVRDLGIEGRVLLDFRFVSVQEMADYYTSADVVVYPYREITTSGALLTGVVHAKAIVASRLPAFEEILRHGDNALLVRYGDVNALVAALLQLIRDPALRRELGDHLAEQQSAIPRWNEIADRTAECYRAAVSECRRCVAHAAEI